MSAPSGEIIVVAAHARRVPAPARAALAEAFRAVRGDGLLLETCHRVELYLPWSRSAEAIPANLPPGVEVLRGPAAERHALEVAVGLDSVVLGEDQILHQLRTALASARAGSPVASEIDRLMSLALRAGRTVRSWRTGPGRTLADEALDAFTRRGIRLDGMDVLVVGTGEMGELAALRARAVGARPVIASRSAAHAAASAAALGATTVAFDPGEAAVTLFGAIVVALAGPWRLSPPTIDRIANGPATIVDLSMPSAVPDTLVQSLGDRYVSVDALASEAGNPGSSRAGGRARDLVERTLVEFERWAEGWQHRAVAQALVERAEAERSAQLARLWLVAPEIEPAARLAVERMSRQLTERLFREALERLRHDPEGRLTSAARELFSL